MLWAFPESGQDIRLPDIEQTGTRWDRQRDTVAGPSRHKKGITRIGEKAGKRWEEPQHGSRASFQESRLLSSPCLVHAKHMHAPGNSYKAFPGPEGETKNPGPPQPQGLTLCDLQHQIRPAPRQGWQAISRTGVGDRGTQGRHRGDRGQVQKETRTWLHSTTGRRRDSEALRGTFLRLWSLNQRKSEVTLALLATDRGGEPRTVMSTRWHRENLTGRVGASHLCLCMCVCGRECPTVPPRPR